MLPKNWSLHALSKGRICNMERVMCVILSSLDRRDFAGNSAAAIGVSAFLPAAACAATEDNVVRRLRVTVPEAELVDLYRRLAAIRLPDGKWLPINRRACSSSFDRGDHVVVHNCRWRLGRAEGGSNYDNLEKRLAPAPIIMVPTIRLEGDANSAPHPDPSAYATKFPGTYSSRLIKGGAGHNLPQEALRDPAEAIFDLAEA
jgi:hypothetical protein